MFSEKKAQKRAYYCADFFLKNPASLLTNPRVIENITKNKDEQFITMILNREEEKSGKSEYILGN